MTGLLIIMALTVVVGLLAAWVGADTRDGQDWRHRTDGWCPADRPVRRRVPGEDLRAVLGRPRRPDRLGDAPAPPETVGGTS